MDDIGAISDERILEQVRSGHSQFSHRKPSGVVLHLDNAYTTPKLTCVVIEATLGPQALGSAGNCCTTIDTKIDQTTRPNQALALLEECRLLR